jgi:hypothetical protein
LDLLAIAVAAAIYLLFTLLPLSFRSSFTPLSLSFLSLLTSGLEAVEKTVFFRQAGKHRGPTPEPRDLVRVAPVGPRLPLFLKKRKDPPIYYGGYLEPALWT